MSENRLHDTSRPIRLKTKENSILDDYIVYGNEILGEGVTGQVILCEHRQTHIKYALKVHEYKNNYTVGCVCLSSEIKFCLSNLNFIVYANSCAVLVSCRVDTHAQ